MEFEELFDKFAKYDDTMFSMKGMAEYFYKAGREDMREEAVKAIKNLYNGTPSEDSKDGIEAIRGLK